MHFKDRKGKKNHSYLKFVSSTFSFFFHENEECHISLYYFINFPYFKGFFVIFLVKTVGKYALLF